MFSDENNIHDNPPNTKKIEPPKAKNKNKIKHRNSMGTDIDSSHCPACQEMIKEATIPTH